MDCLEIPEWIAFDGSHAAMAGRLINFTTGSYELRESHRRWLREKIVPKILERQHPWIDIYGYASKKGNVNSNLLLSKSRAEAVKNYIAQELSLHGRSIDGIVNIDRGFGEEAPLYIAGDSDDSPYWRAVEVVVFGAKPRMTRPPKTPHESIPATKFEIRVVGGGSASIIGQADNYFFQIVDLIRKETAFYWYTGGGLGVSIPKLPGIGSMTFTGPPKEFHTDRSVRLYQFNAEASLYQDPGGALGPFSVGGTLRLSFKNIHDSSGLVFTNPRIIPIEGGAGIQMPGLGSASEGVFALASNIFQFTGY